MTVIELWLQKGVPMGVIELSLYKVLLCDFARSISNKMEKNSEIYASRNGFTSKPALEERRLSSVQSISTISPHAPPFSPI